MSTAIRAYVRSLALDAYVVGGAVRDDLLGIRHADEDFLVPGVDHDGLRRALEPHGRVEDMEVHGQLVGVRLHPADRAIARRAPAGIELTPPRLERSTGPRHGDFEIVVDPDIGIVDDMGRRDFTVNAMARSLATGRLVDPFGGLGDLGRRELRIVARESFQDDPLRLLRGLRLVSQLGFVVSGETFAQMRLGAGGLAHVSAERIGGGVAADGMGELSKLLLGREPDRALRLARDSRALVAFLPEFRPALGYGLDSGRQPLPLDDHLFAVVRSAARAGASLEVRLAALLHDLGKPAADTTGGSHAEIGAAIAAVVLERLRYPVRVQRHVERIVAGHAFHLEPWSLEDDRGRATRRFLRDHGRRLAADLVAHKRADLDTKVVLPDELVALERLALELEREADAPHAREHLVISGDDLIAIGVQEGPALGRLLDALLDVVVDDPAANDRAVLLERARERVA